jgi:hypothetical protein
MRSGRVALVTTASVAVVVVAFWAARSLASSGAVVASAALGVLAMIVTGSVAEWWVHARLMHRRTRVPFGRLIFELHHRAHHWTHYPPDAFYKDRVTYVPVVPLEPERPCRGLAETAGAVASQALFYATFVGPPALVAFPLTGNVGFSVAMATVSLALVALAIHLHDSVHCPGHGVFERFGWFRALDRHHYIHHVDTRANVNLVLPLGDFLFGTLRTGLTDEELERWPVPARGRSSARSSQRAMPFRSMRARARARASAASPPRMALRR